MALLKEARETGIPAVWLQPGSFDEDVLRYAKAEFKVAIGGLEGGTLYASCSKTLPQA